MASKNQIAQDTYGCPFEDLGPGQKAYVTREFNDQEPEAATRAAPRATPRATVGDDFVRCEFGRPGYNGVKSIVVEKGTTMDDALEQSGMGLNRDKEGVLVKSAIGGLMAGAVVMFNDAVVDGATYLIVPGIDSSSC